MWESEKDCGTAKDWFKGIGLASDCSHGQCDKPHLVGILPCRTSQINTIGVNDHRTTLAPHEVVRFYQGCWGGPAKGAVKSMYGK